MHKPFLAVLAVLVGFSAGQSKIPGSRICLKTPWGSLQAILALAHTGECYSDSDCLDGAQCCYSGYVQKCTFPEPCERVVCKDGYLCKSRETPCEKPPCPLEATCLTADQVLCVAPICDTVECKPGFERVRGADGCPTCQCVKKIDCESNCRIFCARGFETDARGCPLCRCKPEPENPCTNKSCGPDYQCRFVLVVCKKAPCIPVATCVPILQVPYENSCSMTDRTTVGLPVLYGPGTSEVDCSSEVCPDNTVCTSLGRQIKRCCWQITQEQVFPPSKPGDCPLTRNNSELTQECEIDDSCPGNQKCCFRQTDQSSCLSLGVCTRPINNAVIAVPSECHSFTFIRILMTMLGIC